MATSVKYVSQAINCVQKRASRTQVISHVGFKNNSISPKTPGEFNIRVTSQCPRSLLSSVPLAIRSVSQALERPTYLTFSKGGSVIKSILEHPELSKTYKLRGVTRDVAKPAAVALKEKGVEMVAADLNDKSAVSNAVKGSSVVFGVTNCISRHCR